MQCFRQSVLLIDSHPDTLSMLAMLLGQYETESTSCASEAVSAAAQRHYDLYLMENRLPDDSGINLCYTLRQMDPGSKVIFFSSSGSSKDRENGIRAGAADYVLKPDVDELIYAVEAIFGERSGSEGENPVLH
jgi:DNA-binding response OmpR family regulator